MPNDRIEKVQHLIKVESQRSKFLRVTSRMAELPLFSDSKDSGDSIELSEIESLCTNCEQNVSMVHHPCMPYGQGWGSHYNIYRSSGCTPIRDRGVGGGGGGEPGQVVKTDFCPV